MDFREIYDAHLPFVWRSLRRLGVPESEAADATQEVFLVIHRKLPEFEGRAKITTWVFRICMRVASDRRRRAHVRREVYEESGVPECEDRADGPVRMMERMQDLALFEAAMGRMDMGQRAVFSLFELEGMTGDEIAEALEIPLGTVYSRLRGARESFRRAVKSLGAAPVRQLARSET
jgi:RNA polymerase sigma-70 factor (ECF subfamily)